MPIIDARLYKTLLICPDKALSNELGPVLAHGLPLAPINAVDSYPNRRELLDLSRTFGPVLCLLDVSTSTAAAFEVMSNLQTSLAPLPVVAILSANNPDLVLQCVRQGAADFLVRPFTHDQIDSCIEKIARLMPAPNSQPKRLGKVIGVMPAKGAAGATTIACNLAFQCKRAGARRILLADMDPLTGTISFVLKVKSSYSFMDVLHRQGALDGDLWRQMVTVSNGIDVLLPPESFVDPGADLESAAPILDYAQSVYDVIILDCGGPFGNWNLSLARVSDQVLLLTTTELPSLQAAQRAMAYFEHNRVDASKIKLVVNRLCKDLGLSLDNISKTFHGEIFHTIPADPDSVQRSLMDGKPIPAGTPIGRTLAALADKLINVRHVDMPKTAAKSGLFSSIFSK
jgi:pilus assembly protein CpaE